MKAVSKVSQWGLTAGNTYNVSITDLNCYVVTLESGFKTVIGQGHFVKT
jgi:hypothetical protein